MISTLSDNDECDDDYKADYDDKTPQPFSVSLSGGFLVIMIFILVIIHNVMIIILLLMWIPHDQQDNDHDMT